MRLSLVLSFVLIALSTVTRLILMFWTGVGDLPPGLWPGVLLKGLLFDVATAAYILPPFLLIEALLPTKVKAWTWVRRFSRVVLFVSLFLLLFNGVAELVFWDEFHTRFNFIALDYLIYTTEVLNNIWQSYPIVWILGLLAALSFFVARFLSRRFLAGPPPRLSTGARAAFVALALLAPVLSFRFVHVQMMARPDNAFAEEISGTGLFTLAAAARHNELDYDKFYATIPEERADKILKDLGVEWSADEKRRAFEHWTDDEHDEMSVFLARRPKRVVLISVESLSAHFVGAYGSEDHLTPVLDDLTKNGLWFANVFATGTRTVRGLEALSLATPPVPGQAIIRRPKNDDLASIGEMLRFQKFAVFFFYGGNGFFDNMNAFFESNGYEIRDRKTIPNDKVTFENAWGVADEDLYDHALRELDAIPADGPPVFAHIMTTSNHRPYTYPAGKIDLPSGKRKGAVKYTDYAIGAFIEKARTRPWFKDTLFVIVADHCASVAGRTELPVRDYRIPLIFYGPGIVKPGRVDRMVSQIDIPPTLLDMLGAAGDDNMFGKELHDQVGAPRAFISNYQSLGYYKDDRLVVLKPRRVIEGFRVDPKTWEATPEKPDPVLVDEAIAYYQTASRAYKKGQLKLLWR